MRLIAFAACLMAGTSLLVAPAGAGETLSAAEREAGRAMFVQYNCHGCHELADADASGSMGPAFDGDDALTADRIARSLREGGDGMPSYEGALSDEQIAALSAYIVAVRK